MSGTQSSSGGDKGKGKEAPKINSPANKNANSSPSRYIVSRKRVDDEDPIHDGTSPSSSDDAKKASPKAQKPGSKDDKTSEWSEHYDSLTPHQANGQRILQRQQLNKDAVSEADMRTGQWRRTDAKDPKGPAGSKP